MIQQLLKGFVDAIYGTGRVRRKFENENPTEIVLAADASKGIVTTNREDIRRGLNWITSQRAVVLLTDKKITCGKWVIPLDNIESAQLIKISSLLGGGQVLKVETRDNQHYQFGMQINPAWINQQALPLTIEEGKVKTSPFSIIMRVILAIYLAYWLYETFY